MAQSNRSSNNIQVNLNIEDEPPQNQPRNILQRVDPVARATAARNNLGLGDRLNHVFREIRPLVEHARMGNNARLSLPTWLPRNPPGTHQAGETSLQRPQSSIAHVNLGPNTQTYIVSERVAAQVQRQLSNSHGVSTSVSNDSNLSNEIPQHSEINITGNSTNNNNNNNDNAENDIEDGLPQIVDIRGFTDFMCKYAPFFLILFIKYLYDCREGIFTYVILVCSFVHSNSLVRRENGKQMDRSVTSLFSELIFTLCCVFVILFLFGDGKILPNVLMISPASKMNIWELLWLILVSDMIVKVITVDIKIVVTMQPGVLLPYQKRGKVYGFVEAVSQMYRCLLTIQPWLFYLLQSYEGAEKMVGIFLSSLFVIAKLIDIYFRVQWLKKSTWTLIQCVNLGTKPTNEQMVAAGDTCPICHDDYSSPARLECGHVFCDLCISAWLDREHTCPLCRAKVSDQPAWRDGSTTYDLQLY